MCICRRRIGRTQQALSPPSTTTPTTSVADLPRTRYRPEIPDDVDVRFLADPTLTDGEALYEAAFGPDEPQTDFCEATARQGQSPVELFA